MHEEAVALALQVSSFILFQIKFKIFTAMLVVWSDLEHITLLIGYRLIYPCQAVRILALSKAPKLVLLYNLLVKQVDPELAMAEADKVEDDEDLRKKLWLMVAKHVVEQEKGTKRENIRKAIAFLKETDGLLKIEDILPFFPDFALIDDFKVGACFCSDGFLILYCKI